MSRIGKQLIIIPEGVTVTINDGDSITVKGPLGELKRKLGGGVTAKVDGNVIVTAPASEEQEHKMHWGTHTAHIRNMVHGVTEGFTKRLIVDGVGFRAELSDNKLTLSLGYSHPIVEEIPDGLNVSVKKGTITINGSDIEQVGQFSATVRSHRTPEPYKGKGIRYDDEVIRRKEGKKAATVA